MYQFNFSPFKIVVLLVLGASLWKFTAKMYLWLQDYELFRALIFLAILYGLSLAPIVLFDYIVFSLQRWVESLGNHHKRHV